MGNNRFGTETPIPAGPRPSFNHESARKTPQGMKFYQALLVGSVIAAGVTSLIVNMMYNNLLRHWPDIMLVGISFAIFFGIGGVLALIIESVKGRLENFTVARALVVLLIGMVICFITGAFLQFIYGLGGRVQQISFDDYYFVIDDSGSMLESDPNYERYNALRSILAAQSDTMRVGLIRFNQQLIDQVPMDKLTQNQRHLIDQSSKSAASDGGTDIQMALLTAISQYQSVREPDRAMSIILLSDGLSRVNRASIINSCLEQGIVLNSVSLGDKWGGIELLRSIAQATGGSYYSIRNIGEFKSTIEKMTVISSERNLLDFRPGRERTGLFWAFLRVLFILILGGLVCVLTMLLLGELPAGRNNRHQLAVGGLAALLAGFVLEAGFGWLINGSVLRLVAFILMALLFLFYPHYAANKKMSFDGITPGAGQKSATVKNNENVLGQPAGHSENKRFS